MFTIHSSVLKQVLIIIIWFVCYFYFSSLCFNYFCQVSALTKQALVYSAHLLYSEPPATQLISFEVAFVPILQRSGRARALPFVKVGLQKGRVTLAELAPCPGCQVSASCLQLFLHIFVYGGSSHFLYSAPPSAELEELEDAAASILGRFAGAAPGVESRRGGATIGVGSAALKLFFSASFAGLY